MPKTQPTLSGVSGAGLGLRRGFIDDLLAAKPQSLDFVELAPENWINMGGVFREKFEAIADIYPVTTHGLSLSLGGLTPIDTDFVKDVKAFLDKFKIPFYSEHLSACSDDGHMYDLMPIPFTEEAARYVVKRIRQVQDILERTIAIENVSFYAMQTQELSEIEFTRFVLEEADCHLLLDVNNAYVNSVNHKAYTPKEFIDAMPTSRIAMVHIAGHYQEAEDLLVDTHGADVITHVWRALDDAYAKHGPIPTLLERDFNFPQLNSLIGEVGEIHARQQKNKQIHGQKSA